MDSKTVQIIMWVNNIKYRLKIMYMLSTQVITLYSQVGNLIYWLILVGFN